jgi:hypothetical protein
VQKNFSFSRSALALAALGVMAAMPAHAVYSGKATLTGADEVPLVLTAGEGTLKARANQTQITYTLSYRNMSSNVTQAHIHIGQAGVNGGVAVTLCSDIDGPGAGTPPCPDSAVGEVTGVITSANITGPVAQGLAAGDFDALVGALRKGQGYVNVHTQQFPGGEIRGRLNLNLVLPPD